MSYDDWKTTEPSSWYDEEPQPGCARCGGRVRTPTGPYCGPCARTIDEQVAAGFNPHERSNA